MIAAGEGTSLLPALSIEGRAMLDSLVAIRPLEPDIGRTVALVWRRTDPRGAQFQQLAEMLRAALPQGVAVTAP